MSLLTAADLADFDSWMAERHPAQKKVRQDYMDCSHCRKQATCRGNDHNKQRYYEVWDNEDDGYRTPYNPNAGYKPCCVWDGATAEAVLAKIGG